MTKTVGIVLFPGVEELDFVGPYEVFGGLTFQDRDWRVITISEAGDSVKAANGLSINVDHSFDDAPRLDVLLLPGGLSARKEVDNLRMIEFVQRAGKEASYVTSVCTGAFILHRAGFLFGKRATTHWGAVQGLRELGDVEVVSERFVHDGSVITSAGVSAGIDMALYLVSLLKDAQTAKNVQKMMEYYPQPPSFEEAPV
ncbi:MAG: DJ-1/PfpI family protein [Chloroflexi bacterium]|nr:DJ-1/PfpI family protein [Chloroflexota bacterium]